jgi:hypothetical protein
MLAAIALASAIRLQALVLLLILPTALVLKIPLAGASEGTLRSRRRVTTELRRYWFSFAALAAGLLAYVAYKTAQGMSLKSGLSTYQSTVEVHYSVRDAARWVVYHFGEIAFSVGMIPASALIVLFALAWRRGFMARAAEQAYVAVAVATSFWIVVEAGTFASRYSLRIEERNMFYVEPLLLLALVLWLAKGSPRPSGATAVAVLLPTALLLTIPIEGLLNVSITADTIAFIPLLRLTERLNGAAAEMRTLLDGIADVYGYAMEIEDLNELQMISAKKAAPVWTYDHYDLSRAVRSIVGGRREVRSDYLNREGFLTPGRAYLEYQVGEGSGGGAGERRIMVEQGRTDTVYYTKGATHTPSTSRFQAFGTNPIVALGFLYKGDEGKLRPS